MAGEILATGKQGLMANGGKTQREAELEKKISILERCIGELTLEKELLKKNQRRFLKLGKLLINIRTTLRCEP
ncbi:MAG: hypothetical protein IPM57_09925 [Oligoflexia bacterium]|nr:hypothetical protein [Oligoflexia bacterium]